jgi:hypothetical protein
MKKNEKKDSISIKLNIEDFAKKYTDKIKELAHSGNGNATVTPDMKDWADEALKTIDKIKNGEVIPVDENGNEMSMDDVRKRILGDEYEEEDDDWESDEWTNSPEDLAEAERQVGVCLGLMKQEEEKKEKEKTRNELKTKNVFYCVSMNLWAIRNGRHGAESTVSAHGSNSYHNTFKTYKEALNYAHLLMMMNHGSKTHDWDKFSQSIEIIEKDDTPHSAVGYRHFKMSNGMERFEGFDISSQFPCIVDDIIIEKRVFMSLEMDFSDKDNPKPKNVQLNPLQKEYYMQADPVSEFTEQQHKDNQKFVDDLANELGGVESLYDDKNADASEEEGDDFDQLMNAIKKKEKGGN